MRVGTYVCRVKLEEKIKTIGFESERHKAHINILYTAYIIKQRIAVILKPFSVTPEQFNIMRILRGKIDTGLSIKEISSRLIEKNSNVSRIIDKLERKYLAKRERSGIDKREVKIHLTKEGLELINVTSKALSLNQDTILNISEVDAKTLNSIFDKD
jgi:DNA-binding MarR family transcriptional regulator